MTLGFNALAHRYQITPVQPLRVISVIGSSPQRNETPTLVQAQFPSSHQPADTVEGQFEFGLKYEEIHLEFFAKLFAACGPEPIEDWCQAKPLRQYARRTGFFYEWLTGLALDVPAVTNGAYVDAVAPGLYLTSVLDAEFGSEMLLRSASWLTFKESQASFTIEREADKGDQIQRFAHVIAEHCGRIDNPLNEDTLRLLQAGILGPDALRLGVRRSPVFLGRATLHQNIVHYIAPHFERVPPMLEGLKAFEAATRGTRPVIRAGVLSFAFVYIHPMCDGNGRIHRFIINDTLLRDGAIPNGVILPVSASIINSTRSRADYDQVLEVFSRPLMRRYASDYHFGEQTLAEYGTPVDLVFDAYDDADFAWRFSDLTEHAAYTCKIVEFTIREQMADEARVLKRFNSASQRLMDVMEMPDSDAARSIRSLNEAGWIVSSKLLQDCPFLADDLRRLQVIEAVQSAFEDRAKVEIMAARARHQP